MSLSKLKETSKEKIISTAAPTSLSLDQQELRKLEELFDTQQYRELEPRILLHIQNHPSAFFLYNILGLTQAGLGKFEDALNSYNKVLHFQPNHSGVHCNIGLALLNLGRFEDSIASYQNALQIDSNLTNAYKNMGVGYNNLKNFEEAINCYKQALQRSPEDAEILRNLGIAYDNLNQNSEAIAHYKSALNIAPQCSLTLNRLGLSLLKTGESAEATLYFKRAIEQQSDNYEFYANLGTAFNNIDQYDDACRCFAKALELQPDFTKGRIDFGSVLMNQEKYEEAAYHFDVALESEPENPNIHYLKGRAHAHLNHIDATIECFEKALSLSPDEVEVLCQLGATFSIAGRLEDSLAMFEKALKVEPDNVKALFLAGVVHMDFRQYDTALEYFTKATELKPDFTNAFINIGTVHRNLGNEFLALQFYQQAIEIDPNSELALKQFAETVRSYNKIKLTPNLRNIIKACFTKPNISSVAVNPVANVLLKKDFETVSDKKLFSLDLIAELHTLTDGLLYSYLMHTITSDIILERILTGVRSYLLESYLKSPDRIINSENLLHLIEGFASHGFANEFVWFVTSEEQQNLQRLISQVTTTLQAGDIPHFATICLLASYENLTTLPAVKEWALAAYENAEPKLKSLLLKHVIEPEREAILSQAIDKLTPIEDEVSSAVQSQYELNPYPRWDSVTTYMPIAYTQAIYEDINSRHITLETTSENPEVLIAGCGTGKQPICSALRYLNSDILAIDLSLTSLAYAKRKADELNAVNIRFAQADILKLGCLEKKFDIVECGGVLHHMKEPEKGLQVLLSLLKPGGYIKLGLYSKYARQAITAYREKQSGERTVPSLSEIQALRQKLFKTEPDFCDHFVTSNDFYTTSAFRDLLLHVQEHQFDIPGLEQLMSDNSLDFLGFTMQDSTVKPTYIQIYPDDPNCLNLRNWDEFEKLNPSTFIRMYQFWCRYNPDA